MALIKKLKCVLCGKEFDPESGAFTCTDCGPDGTLDVLYDYEEIKGKFTQEALSQRKEKSISRYIDLLPISDLSFFPNLKVGCSPLYESSFWAKKTWSKTSLNKRRWQKPHGFF